MSKTGKDKGKSPGKTSYPSEILVSVPSGFCHAFFSPDKVISAILVFELKNR
jgi:hypothetical protein